MIVITSHLMVLTITLLGNLISFLLKFNIYKKLNGTNITLDSNNYGFKNRIGERTGKGSGSRITSRIGYRTSNVINNLINNFKII
jgi:hypothetical protein